jgi:pyruvate, orthophosphate dikinase
MAARRMLRMATEKKFIYFFGGGRADGTGAMKDLLGGKGAGLAEMTNAGIPVPPGFTITTEVCNLFFELDRKVPAGLDDDIRAYMKKVEGSLGGKFVFGDADHPLLVSVRSGSKFSMPGMMDTVLNLGLNDTTIKGLIRMSANERFAWDAYRRFIQMFGNVVMGIEKEVFENIIHDAKKKKKIKFDLELNAVDLRDLADRFKVRVKQTSRRDFPQDPWEQLTMARDAVFGSWDNPRAITYRKLNDIPGNLGTAVNIQAMVFGNMGDTSATGVGFTRNPSTGLKEFYGEYLTDAQGEDVVAGIRTPHPIADLEKEMPNVYRQLHDITSRLELHYRDIQDFEFTVQEGLLYMLQTRTGKRTAHAAVKIAVDMVAEGLISKEEAVLRVDPASLDQLLHPVIDSKARVVIIARGLPASPGAASGKVVFTADDAVQQSKKEKVILVRPETTPDDIHGMDAAKGILTARGGMTSHAAVVARGMGKPCVTGCESIRVDLKAGTFTAGKYTVKAGDYITVDGGTGRVILGKVPTVEPSVSGDFAALMKWADEIRTLGVWANADIPRDAKAAKAFGAEGIGLCRTEHMFFAEDRVPIVQQMIMAETTEERENALAKLLPMQRSDFKGLFDAMDGLPVTIRLLDPPLHEFLPKREELMVEVAVMKAKKAPKAAIVKKEIILRRVEELHEFNPMLGLRGCRLGIIYSEITRMQARAIIEAACDMVKKGKKAKPEIMIPLVVIDKELSNQKALIDETARDVMKKKGVQVEYTVGTMIELPRAVLIADEIAKEAEFFSFGTNDLTQTTYGFSRDDSGKFINYYLDNGILEKDPFMTLDEKGVGALVKMGIEKGRSTRPDLKIGICGEHGGDPASVEQCHRLGLTYVSCSPYRVPIARLAAAHAKLKETGIGGSISK